MPYLQELMKNQYIMMQVQKLCLFFSSYGTNERKGFFTNGKNKNNMIISYIKKKHNCGKPSHAKHRWKRQLFEQIFCK